MKLRLYLDRWNQMGPSGMRWNGVLLYCLDNLKSDGVGRCGEESNSFHPLPSYVCSCDLSGMKNLTCSVMNFPAME